MIENGTFKARTHYGLETLLEKELESAGATYLFKTDGAVQFKADEPSLYEFLIRTSVCISLEILLSKPFDIREAELSALSASVNWTDVIPLESIFKVEAFQDGEVSRKLSILARGMEEDIQEAFQLEFEQVPKIADDEHEAEFMINLHVDESGSCYLALEAGGTALRSRGFTDPKNGGVLSAAMAAGLIHLSGWDTETTFIDPYAGNGNLLIEAARIAKKRSPGFDDDTFLMKKWRTFRHALWKKTRESTIASIRKDVKWIYGSDSKKPFISHIHDRLKKVRLNDNISIRQAKPDDIFYPDKPGIILTAPPADADPTVLTEFVKNTKRYGHNYILGLFTQLHNLDSIVNMKPEKVTKLTFDGREYSFMMFKIFNPKKRFDAEVVSETGADVDATDRKERSDDREIRREKTRPFKGKRNDDSSKREGRSFDKPFERRSSTDDRRKPFEKTGESKEGNRKTSFLSKSAEGMRKTGGKGTFSEGTRRAGGTEESSEKGRKSGGSDRFTDRRTKSDRLDRPDRSTDRNINSDRPDRSFDRKKSDRLDRPDRSTDRNINSDRPDRSSDRKKSDRLDRPDRSTDKKINSDRPDRSFDRKKSDRLDRPDRSTDRNINSDRPDRSSDRVRKSDGSAKFGLGKKKEDFREKKTFDAPRKSSKPASPKFDAPEKFTPPASPRFDAPQKPETPSTPKPPVFNKPAVRPLRKRTKPTDSEDSASE